jgi:hypothetical protein
MHAADRECGSGRISRGRRRAAREITPLTFLAPEKSEQGREPSPLVQRVFPNPNDSVVLRSQLSIDGLIAFPIGRDLRLPKLCSSARGIAIAARAPVPETTVDEHGNS